MSSVSVTGKTWSLKKFDQEKATFFKDNYFIDDFTAKLLAIKKIDNKDIKNFLNPSIKNILPNPNILKDMEKATKRTVESIIKKEKIGIFGDYDVDGASSTAILGKFFEQINCPYEIYIPDRKLEGYGPSVKGFQSLIDNGAKIMINFKK